MAIGLITRFPEGMGAEQYDTVNEKVIGEEAYAELPDAERVETEIHSYVIP